MSALEGVADQLAAVDPRLLGVALVFHLLNHVLRSLAWRNVLAAAYPEHRVGLVPVAAAYASGVALNAVAPARGGDAVKVALARAALPGSSLPTIASTMSVLVLFDMVAATILVLVVGISGLVPLTPSAPDVGGALVPLVGLSLLAVGFVLWRLVPRLHVRLRGLWCRVRQGGAILRTPVRYVHRVALVQLGAWCCRIAVVVCLMAAFGLPASIPLAGVVMVLTGLSTIVPLTPGGAGTQQVVLAAALTEIASATAIVAFSVGMQAVVTLVNALLGVVAAMAIFRTARPLAAVRSGLRLARAEAA